ncbi:hypothetical protein E1162_19165 [Rhodobacteraceae bacterium RKSG542]|uniref:hypothetical protein n=1 Tax=Pseudovibrio flavus TaxID=2529854 RepID=UPI0012BC6936|nr:hypothetical protein [Pseudovibrio flavus]MTI19368.1 hypothetical protein [Pseudovibrio flavus]
MKHSRAVLTLTLAATMLGAPLAASSAFAQDVLGKTLTHVWTATKESAESAEKRVETLYCDGKTLVWNDISDLDKVVSGKSDYKKTQITPEILQVSWKGKNGDKDAGYVWTYDFKNNKFYGVIVDEESPDTNIVEGEFQTVSGVTPSPGHEGCDG